MKVVSIDASPKQLSRLRNGHRVRIKQSMSGSGINLIVDPSKFDAISRSFSKGSAYQVQLSPDELAANKTAMMEGQIEGQGIFAGGRVSIPSGKIKKALTSAGKKTAKGIVEGEKAVRKNPVSRAVIKTGVPIIAEQGLKAAAMYAGADPKTAAAIGKVGAAGTKAGLTSAGYGLYAGSQGRGMCGCGRMCGSGVGCCGGRIAGPPSRLPERASIAIGGNLLMRSAQLPPALQSDPMGANFLMNTQLPPSYQRGGCKFV